MGRAQGAVGDISKYQQALQNPDLRLQYALVQEMLKLQDPALQRLAKEHALFSTNPVMREAAIKAILDSGATLRIQVAGEQEKYVYVSKWASGLGGTFVQNRGEVLVVVPPAVNDACWGDKDRCIFRQVGSTLQYNPHIVNLSYLPRFVLTLGNDGVLRGTASNPTGETLQAQIDLKE
ncbi:hypothetical protein HW561_20620 [Rhodobacteraceae bacterium B1Z28]|uniref:Uncharacterized protein n=1 Tax=Ruegeria haliotis TaxID=2747601 RepID=A0ABX2PX33_9RHOB|nr:hypothetical protein [Ruegeria haliotis]NVO58201.1 hypothetical protein [Ruegeria haliotis]